MAQRSQIIWVPLAFLLAAAGTGAQPASAPAGTSGAEAAKPAKPAKPADVSTLLAQLQRSEATAKRKLQRLTKASQRVSQRTLVRGRAYVKRSRLGHLPLGGGLDAMLDHAAHLERLRTSLKRDLQQQRTLSAQRKRLSQSLRELQARRAPLEAQARAMAMSRAALLAQRDRSLAYQRAFSSLGDHTAVYAGDPELASSTHRPNAGATFAARQGQLPLPLPGRVEIRSAQRPGAGPGLELLAPAGTPVQAVHQGRVVFADHYESYGRTVILDHAGGYYTLYANLGSVEVAVKDELQAGARLGTVGPAPQGAHVYLEIKQGTRVLKPAPWFGL